MKVCCLLLLALILGFVNDCGDGTMDTYTGKDVKKDSQSQILLNMLEDPLVRSWLPGPNTIFGSVSNLPDNLNLIVTYGDDVILLTTAQAKKLKKALNEMAVLD